MPRTAILLLLKHISPNHARMLKNSLKDALFPIMLKAIDGKVSLLRAGHKMFITETKEKLLDLYDRYEDPIKS